MNVTSETRAERKSGVNIWKRREKYKMYVVWMYIFPSAHSRSSGSVFLRRSFPSAAFCTRREEKKLVEKKTVYVHVASKRREKAWLCWFQRYKCENVKQMKHMRQYQKNICTLVLYPVRVLVSWVVWMLEKMIRSSSHASNYNNNEHFIIYLQVNWNLIWKFHLWEFLQGDF